VNLTSFVCKVEKEKVKKTKGRVYGRSRQAKADKKDVSIESNWRLLPSSLLSCPSFCLSILLTFLPTLSPPHCDAIQDKNLTQVNPVDLLAQSLIKKSEETRPKSRIVLALKFVGQLSLSFVFHIALSAARPAFCDIFMHISMVFYVTAKATMKWEKFSIFHSDLFFLKVFTCDSSGKHKSRQRDKW